MFALLLLAAGSSVAAADKAEFEAFWRDHPEMTAQSPITKDAAWALYEWTQAQFSLGFCSQYIPADDAEVMRHIPDEDGTLRGTELGRWFLDQGDKSFRAGMSFRSEVRPTLQLCEKELKGRAETLKAFQTSKLAEHPN